LRNVGPRIACSALLTTCMFHHVLFLETPSRSSVRHQAPGRDRGAPVPVGRRSAGLPAALGLGSAQRVSAQLRELLEQQASILHEFDGTRRLLHVTLKRLRKTL